MKPTPSTLAPSLVAPTLLALLIALGFPDAAQAQKLYRWVDAEGKVQYSDSLPPEAVDQARRELNKLSGSTTASIDRALTEEERQLAAAQEAEAARAAEAEQQSRQRDRMLLSFYPTEADLTRSYRDRLDSLGESIKAAQIGLESQRDVLVSLLDDAANRELAGERVDAKVLDTARQAHHQQEQLRTMQSRREAEHSATQSEYEETLARYRQLTQTSGDSSGGR